MKKWDNSILGDCIKHTILDQSNKYDLSKGRMPELLREAQHSDWAEEGVGKGLLANMPSGLSHTERKKQKSLFKVDVTRAKEWSHVKGQGT